MVKHRRVVSLLKLAENVFQHSPLILKNLSLDSGLKKLQQKYTDMIFVYCIFWGSLRNSSGK